MIKSTNKYAYRCNKCDYSTPKYNYELTSKAHYYIFHKSLFHNKHLLIAPLIFAALFDYLTFVWHSNFASLETNVILTHSNMLVFTIFKFGVVACLIWLFYKIVIKKHQEVRGLRFKSFTIVYLIIIFTAYQTYGGISNMEFKQQVLEDVQKTYGNDTYPTLESIPKSVVKNEYSGSKQQKTDYYLYFAFMLMFLPIILTLVSFKIWEWYYF